MRLVLSTFATLLLLAPLVHAQDKTPAPAASTAAPAAAASSAMPDRPSLEDIRNFTRVYEIIRQAYVKKVDNKALMGAAIKGMLSELDPHSAYLDKQGMRELREETSGQYAGLGVVVTSRDQQLVVIAPIDDTPAAKAGLKPGDVILKIDGAPVDPQDVETSIDKLRGKAGSKITLTLVHDQAGSMPITKTLTRALISMTSVHMRDIEPGYVYIRISQFQSDTARDLDSKLEQLIARDGQPKGIILDLRSNPGGLVMAATGVADAFLDGGLIVSTRGRVEGSDMSFRAHPGDLAKGAPMVVLVNHGTASAAEILSGALKDHHRALIMGQRTFGKGVVQTVMQVDANHVLKLTTARYYTPDGTSIQAEGITPDIIIPDLVAHTGDAPPSLIDSEADLPHHLHNENPKAVQASHAASARTLADNSALAERDYALAQALSVLKGMVLARQGSSE
ncbi:MAG TPA: S41 family peptidase [Rhodanobacteraceae bacterium]|nr:S41 family peptidase [Rhodanobacteraceae bacterium]